MASDKTEAPTPKKLRDAAAEGDVAHSRDFSAGLVVAAGTLWLFLAGKSVLDALKADLRAGLLLKEWPAIPAGSWPGLALLLMTVVAAIVAPFATGAFGWQAAALTPRWSRVDPAAGLRRMFGGRALAELAKSLFKTCFLASAIMILLISGRYRLAALAHGDLVSASGAAYALIGTLVLTGTLVLLLIGAVDVPSQILRRRQRLRMSRDETRRELRENDGAPEVRAARRERQYMLATMSARKGMKEATVVLVNPSRFAVALRYKSDSDAVPVVVARGVDEGAAAIRDLATGAAVPILEYPALARALFFTTRPGEAIDSELYLAVATVLAFVLNIEAALASGRLPPSIDVPPTKRFDVDGRRESSP